MNITAAALDYSVSGIIYGLFILEYRILIKNIYKKATVTICLDRRKAKIQLEKQFDKKTPFCLHFLPLYQKMLRRNQIKTKELIRIKNGELQNHLLFADNIFSSSSKKLKVMLEDLTKANINPFRITVSYMHLQKVHMEIDFGTSI